MISLLISITLLGAGNEIKDPRSFFETLYAPIKDIKFEFEGSVEMLNAVDKKWRLENEFSGSFAFRKGMSLKSVSINNKIKFEKNLDFRTFDSKPDSNPPSI